MGKFEFLFIYLFVALKLMYFILDKIHNINRIKNLQDDIASMRKDAPVYYSEILKKEFTAVQNNFVNKQIILCNKNDSN